MRPIARAGYCLLLAAGMAGCVATSPRIVQVGLPQASREENTYADEDLYLTQFTVRNKASVDTKTGEDALRAQFIGYLRDSAKFRKVVDATKDGASMPEDALKLNVDFQASLEGGDMSFLAKIYSAYVLFSISPRSGTATIVGNAALIRRRRTLSQKSWTSSQPFDMIFFGLFRTAPIQAAYKAAYEDVFARVIVPVAAETGPAVSKTELRSLVQESLRDSAEKKKTFVSDVDRPSYKRAETASRLAVVVGIEGYQTIPPADFAERDAQSVKDHLLALGFANRNIIHLPGSLATRSNMEKYLESWLPEHAAPDSLVVVYFSGHGAPDMDSKQAYLMPWDGDPKFLPQTGYPLKRLYGKLNALKSKRVLVMLDSCFSGAGGRSVLPKGARPLVTKLDEGLDGAGRLVVLSASAGDEIALSEEAQGHGLFTYQLLKGLNENEGPLTVRTLYDRLLPRVQDAARQQNRDQTPKLTFADEILADLPLRD